MAPSTCSGMLNLACTTKRHSPLHPARPSNSSWLAGNKPHRRTAQRSCTQASAEARHKPKVVGLGSVGMDYLAQVVNYPKPDEKIRTTNMKVLLNPVYLTLRGCLAPLYSSSFLWRGQGCSMCSAATTALLHFTTATMMDRHRYYCCTML